MSVFPDELRYQEFLKEKERLWESKCSRCGACCGSFDGDPCEHLGKDKSNRYYCRIYENRFGVHKTLSGKKFKCVPIKKILTQSWPGDECCGYKK